MSPEGPTSDAQKRSLDVKFAGGLAWTAGVKWTTQLVTWGSLVIVARLLSTADYGVGEMAGTLTIMSNVLAEFGVGTAVLHMPELSRKTLAQLHTFSCLMCTGVFVLAALASPLVASFYHSTHVAFFVANNLGLLITGVQAVPMGLLSRDMDYRRLSLAEAAMVIVQSMVTVITAWLGWGYWALFAGAVAGKVTAAILVSVWKHVGFAWPRWRDIRAPVELGRQAAVGRVAWSLYTQADGIVVGRVLGPSVLGVYRMAMNLASAPSEKVSTLLMRTVTPLFANVQFDRALVRRYYLIVTETLTLIVMPLMLGLVFVAPAVPIVLGAKWTPAIAPIRWLAFFMILRTLSTLTEQVLISQRLTRFTMRMSILNFVVMPLAFIAAARWQGTSGVAAAWIFLSPVTIFPLLFVLLRHIELPAREYAAAIFPAVAGTGAMCLALIGLNRLLQADSWPPALRLAALVGAGGIVYGAVVFGFFRGRLQRYMNFLSSLRNGKEMAVPAVP
jgi:O-antigen/teichoic acid export membrane protein